MKRKVLLLSYISSQFRELRRVAALLARTGELEPVVFFARAYAQVGGDIRWCAENGIPAIGATGAADSTSDLPPPGTAYELLRRAAAVLPEPLKSGPRWVVSYPMTRRRLRQAVVAARALLDEHRPSLLVIAEDSLDFGTPPVVRAGHDRGVKTAIVPFTIPNPREAGGALARVPTRHVRFGSRRFARSHPQWVYEHEGIRLLRLPAPQALAAEHEGLAPPLPWVLNSGHADAIAVESEEMAQRYLRFGLPAAQLVITGSLAEDTLAAELARRSEGRAALARELSLGPGHLFVAALPPDQHHLSDRSGFADHAAIVRFWVEALLAVPGASLVVVPHPRTDPASIAFVESLRSSDGRRAHLLTRDIASLIPLCDTYVAPASATLRMAIACGIPAVNYDVYRFGYDDYRETPVLHPTRPEELAETVRRLGTDPAFHAEQARRLQGIRDRWARLDGKSGERMLALFGRLAGRA